MKTFTLDIGLKIKDDVQLEYVLNNFLKDTHLSSRVESSGFCFEGRERDIQFEFATELALLEARKNIKEICELNQIEIMWME